MFAVVLYSCTAIIKMGAISPILLHAHAEFIYLYQFRNFVLEPFFFLEINVHKHKFNNITR